jgi:putative copper resistance protein D
MAAAGLGMAWILTGGKYSVSDPYCASLTGKSVLLAIVLMLAALNRWRFGPALASGSSQAVRVFSRSLAVEYVVLAAVIALTATMTSLFSPGH